MRPLDGLDPSVRPAYSGHLYKFVGLSRGRLSRLEGMVLRGEFYFAHPYELNDPFEFRPRFVPISGSPEVVALKLKKYLGNRKGAPKVRPRLSPKVAAMRMRELWRADDGERQMVQMFCMSTIRTHPLLWAHYADGHRGACVHLDSRYAPFGFAQDVDYVEVPPEIVLPSPLAEGTAVVRSLVYTKGLDWKYEQEARVSRYLRGPHPGLGLRWNSQLGTGSPDAVNGITLGANVSGPDQDAILAMVKLRSAPIPVWKGRAHEDRYEFEFDRIQ